MDDITAIYLARHSAMLSARFRLSRPATDLPARLADKHALATTCARYAVPHPETRLVRRSADVDIARQDFGQPLMAKWARPWLVADQRDFRSTAVVRTAEELSAVRLLAERWPGELLLQRYISPLPDTDWFFHGYFRNGSCRFSGTGRKDRAYPPTAGITTYGRWLDNPEIDAIVKSMAARLNYSGVLDLDFRYSPIDDRHYLLDFNPRVGAQFRLFADSMDTDVIRAAYLDLTGEDRDNGSPAFGRTYLVENYDLLRKLIRANGPQEGGRGWLASMRHADELAWYASDDRGPFTGMVRHTFLRALKGRRRH